MNSITQVRVGAKNKKNFNHLHKATTIVPIYRLHLKTGFHSTIDAQQLPPRYTLLRSCFVLQVLVRHTIVQNGVELGTVYGWQKVPVDMSKPFFKDCVADGDTSVDGHTLTISPSQHKTTNTIKFRLTNISKKSDVGQMSHKDEPLYRFVVTHDLMDNFSRAPCTVIEPEPCIFGVTNGGDFEKTKTAYHKIVSELAGSQYLVALVEGHNDRGDVYKRHLRQVLNNLGLPIPAPMFLATYSQVDNEFSQHHFENDSSGVLPQTVEAEPDTSSNGDEVENIIDWDLDEVGFDEDILEPLISDCEKFALEGCENEDVPLLKNLFTLQCETSDSENEDVLDLQEFL